MIAALRVRKAIIDKDSDTLLLYDMGDACVDAKLTVQIAKALIDELVDYVQEKEPKEPSDPSSWETRSEEHARLASEHAMDLRASGHITS